MVQAGAIVVGEKPLETPSLSDDQNEFNALVDELRADEKGENMVGKGKVLSGLSLLEALAAMNIAPDFAYTKPEEDTKMLFVHRYLGHKFSGKKRGPCTAETFRITRTG